VAKILFRFQFAVVSYWFRHRFLFFQMSSNNVIKFQLASLRGPGPIGDGRRLGSVLCLRIGRDPIGIIQLIIVLFDWFVEAFQWINFCFFQISHSLITWINRLVWVGAWNISHSDDDGAPFLAIQIRNFKIKLSR
jgi:hypothetical protein